MNTLKTLLQQADIRRALVVDDAFDIVPLAGDLSNDAGEWANFFDDLAGEDRDAINVFFPRFNDLRADELPGSDEFVGALWNNRNSLRKELVEPLFARYVRDSEDDQAPLNNLLAYLGALGLSCDTAGRRFSDKAAAADLIVVDLFLGSTQGPEALEASISGLKEAISRRRAKPPIVILISRSTRLTEKREVFRDATGLFESAFRILRKAELSHSEKLYRTLTRLARHYSDSLKLANFVSAWHDGLTQARDRTSRLIRTLDLPDYAQLNQLLLSAEGEPTGSYMVDVLDLVLQHECEADKAIINAALALNTLTVDTYPPPYVDSPPDLQTLVYRSLFQHRERLRLRNTTGPRVAFGDIYRLRPSSAEVAAGNSTPVSAPALSTALKPDDALAVLTPACDLQRQSCKHVLFVRGTLRRLDPADWSYREDPVRTSVVQTADAQRYWIQWDLKDIRTVPADDVSAALDSSQGLEIVGRLREAPALALQQKVLSTLGRVGLLAPMPATFPLPVTALLPGPDGKLFGLATPGGSVLEGVCYVGRSDEKRLVFSEDTCEAICDAVASTSLDTVHPNARAAVDNVRSTGELLLALEKGIVLPPKRDIFKEISLPASASNRAIGLISRGSLEGKMLRSSEIRKAGIVLGISDPPAVSVMSGASAERTGSGEQAASAGDS